VGVGGADSSGGCGFGASADFGGAAAVCAFGAAGFAAAGFSGWGGSAGAALASPPELSGFLRLNLNITGLVPSASISQAYLNRGEAQDG
jgi:hypothetical protein